jgi:hypothetical protein
MSSKSLISVWRGSANFQKHLADKLTSIDLKFLESDEIERAKVEHYETENSPMSREGKPMVGVESLQSRVSQLEAEWRRANGLPEF